MEVRQQFRSLVGNFVYFRQDKVCLHYQVTLCRPQVALDLRK